MKELVKKNMMIKIKGLSLKRHFKLKAKSA
jgi:hypothetical protein